ncbi:MAG: hypothetical protein L0Y56_17120, partial [Nitrospira sp.]|nr:hypothetical protein [Nitrospira sp.]
MQEVRALGPEVLLIAGYYEDEILITRQMKELDFMPKLYAVGLSASAEEFGAALGPDVEYVLGQAPWMPYSSLGLPG